MVVTRLLSGAGSEITTVHSSSAAIDPIRDAWRALATSAGNAFLTPEWFDSFRDHRREDPFVVTVGDLHGATIGVAPFVVSRVLGVRVLSFPGSTVGDLFGGLSVPGREECTGRATAVALRERADAWNGLLLREIADDDPWFDALLAGLGDDYQAIPLARSVHPQITFETADWDEFLGDLSSNLRQQVRRLRRRVIDNHDARFRAVTDPAEAEEHISTFVGLHSRRADERSWRSPLTTGSSGAEALARFAVAAAERGWLHGVRIDNPKAPIALTIGWMLGTRYQFFQTSFNPAFSLRSPGIVVVAEMLRLAQEAGVETFDMGAGDANYKVRFAPQLRPLTSWFVTRRSSLAGAAVSARTRARARAGRTLRRIGLRGG